MPRNKNTQDVETVEEQDVVETNAVEESGEKPTKAKKEPKRGELPEGYVTPVGLAKVLGEKGLQTNRAGETLTEVKPQMVYSYIKNAPKDDPFPLETVQDSIGADRQAVKLEDALAWWQRKNERTSARRANAAEKRQKAEQRAAEKAAQAEAGEGSEEQGEVTEAE